MKRPRPWSDDEGDSSSDESSVSDTNVEPNDGSSNDKTKNDVISSQPNKGKKSEVDTRKKSKAVGFEALRRHGYKGGLSVLRVPLPKEEHHRDWSWSNGKDRPPTNETEETYDESQKTRCAIVKGEQLRNVQTQKEKNASFAQKEKRKRDIGQASRGKSYVEEEKRLLRESGVYSGFDL